MVHLSGGAKGGIAFGCLVALVTAITIFVSRRRHRRDNVLGYRATWGTAALEEHQQQVQQADYQLWKEQKAREKEVKKLEKKLRSAGPSRATSIAQSIAPSIAPPERAKVADRKDKLGVVDETDMV